MVELNSAQNGFMRVPLLLAVILHMNFVLASAHFEFLFHRYMLLFHTPVLLLHGEEFVLVDLKTDNRGEYAVRLRDWKLDDVLTGFR